MFDWLGEFFEGLFDFWPERDKKPIYTGPIKDHVAKDAKPVDFTKPALDPLAGWQIINLRRNFRNTRYSDDTNYWDFSLKHPSGQWVEVEYDVPYKIIPSSAYLGHVTNGHTEQEAIANIRKRILRSIELHKLANTPGRNYTL